MLPAPPLPIPNIPPLLIPSTPTLSPSPMLPCTYPTLPFPCASPVLPALSPSPMLPYPSQVLPSPTHPSALLIYPKAILPFPTHTFRLLGKMQMQSFGSPNEGTTPEGKLCFRVFCLSCFPRPHPESQPSLQGTSVPSASTWGCFLSDNGVGGCREPLFPLLTS